MRYPKTRLSLLMFIQFFIWGATGPILSLYLRDCLGFSGAQVGLILGLSALGSIFSPAFMAFVADRLVSSERLLCLLNAVGGVCMFVFSRQTGWYGALAVYVVYQIAVGPMSPLLNAVTFHHSPVERRKFGNIRVWGTIGWIAVAWFFSFGMPNGAAAGDGGGGSRLPMLLDISAAASFVMAAYCLTIPKRTGAAASVLTTAPSVSTTTSSVSTTTPFVSTTTPFVSTTTPSILTTSPSVSTTSSSVSTTASFVSTTTPSVSTTSSFVSTTTSSVSTTTPFVSTTTPSVLTTPSSVSTTAPSVSTTTPFVSTTSSSVLTTSPSVSTPEKGRAHGPAPTSGSISDASMPGIPGVSISVQTAAPASALRVILRPRALALAAATAAITFVDKFYNVGTAPFLRASGLSERAVMPAMSLGQIPEIAAMGVLGFLLARWGARKVILLGVAMEIFRFAVCALGFNMPLIYAGLCVHGLAYTFTMVAAVICLDGFCGADERSGAHQLFNVATAGIGGFLGSYAAGRVMDAFTGADGAVNYRGYWSVPLAISIIIFAVTIITAPYSKGRGRKGGASPDQQ